MVELKNHMPTTEVAPSSQGENATTKHEVVSDVEKAQSSCATSGELSKDSDKDDHEQHCGLRIVNRCYTAAEVSEQMKDARVLRFPRVMDLRSRSQFNRIVIGVLYETFTSKLGNGELYTRWSLTDLAEPEPRRLIVQLRGRAYEHWRKAQFCKAATRKSIFAIMNPRDPEQADTNEWTVRVENPGQLAKLGECPSLGLCNMKNCQLPCNLDLKDRFCKMHLKLAYANKGGRILTGGNVDAHLIAGPKRKRFKGEVAEEEEEKDADQLEQEKRLKVSIALQLDERRFATSEANDNYFRSIREGGKIEAYSTSRVPVLGRGFSEKDGLEIDMATIDTRDKIKAERMIERVVDMRAERRVADCSAQALELNLGIASRQSSGQASGSGGNAAPKTRKKSLQDLMEAMKGKLAARRPGCGPKNKAEEKEDNPLPKRDNGVTASSSCSSRSACVSDATSNDYHVKINALTKDLETAGDDMSRIKSVLDAADSLPIAVLEGPQGSQFYAAVGRLIMHAGRADIRRAALVARRRWRSASFDAMQIQHPQTPRESSSPLVETLPTMQESGNGSDELPPSSLTVEATAPVVETLPTMQESGNASDELPPSSLTVETTAPVSDEPWDQNVCPPGGGQSAKVAEPDPEPSPPPKQAWAVQASAMSEAPSAEQGGA